ncbi:teichuronic acid biosynthesis protein TuaH [Bacillus sp. PS06]|uniref:teichuronic acid biosynthesis protein TuaH n=1 Tax=Bacillus sp. PS06 TaxID=2764176 RepID=UPI0017818FEA|nr:glycosyltransferase [Bacillus sp. PS06]MBD8070882.1 glycosyltransferase [Bacillus sp. PS06]
MSIVHVIVATGEWGGDQLRYRRHRLAEFLLEQEDTKEVVWLCPTPSHSNESISLLPNGIKQWTIQDLLPQKSFRFGRYLDSFHKAKLEPFLNYLKKGSHSERVQLWYTFPGFPILADLFPFDKVIYDCSDLWGAPISGRHSIVSSVRQRIIESAENRVIDRADTIFCTSEYLRKRISQKAGTEKNIFTFENGVEFSRFAENDIEMESVLPSEFDGKVLGFIGGIKPKLDFKLIQQVAQQRHDWLFLFVGPDGTNGDLDFQQLLKEKNVIWTGSVAPQDVPKYMNLIDIGIMPYKPSQYNNAVFPLKLFEFLAAGKPVVGVHLPSTIEYAEGMVYEHLDTNQPDIFIDSCEYFLSGIDDPMQIDRRKQIAQEKNWGSIFEEMLMLVR